MSDFDNNPFDDTGDSMQDFESTTVPAGRPPKQRSSNRNFWVILGVLAAMFVLALIVLAALAFLILPKQSAQRLEEAAQINAQNTATLVAATQNAMMTSAASIYTVTPPPALPAQSSPTPVVVFASATPEATSTVEGTEEKGVGGAPDDAARTATLAYLLTQASTAQPDPRTQTAAAAALRTQTALPQTGFADQVGLPGLFGLALILVVLVFLARRLRLSQT
jgi:LPXTG-motif cell wall-anchored protein